MEQSISRLELNLLWHVDWHLNHIHHILRNLLGWHLHELWLVVCLPFKLVEILDIWQNYLLLEVGVDLLREHWYGLMSRFVACVHEELISVCFNSLLPLYNTTCNQADENCYY